MLLPVQSLRFVGCEHGKRSVRTSGVIVALDVLKDGKLERMERMVNPPVGFLSFEVFEETFAAGIAERTAPPRKGLHYVKGIQ